MVPHADIGRVEGAITAAGRYAALEYAGGLYGVREGGALIWPVCPDCYVGRGFMFRLKRRGGGVYRCMTCGSRFYGGKP